MQQILYTLAILGHSESRIETYCSDYVVTIGTKHSSIDKTWGIRAVPGSSKWPIQAVCMGISPRTTAVGGRAVCIVWPTVIGSFHRFNSTNSLALFLGPHYKYHQKIKKKNHYWRNGASSLSTIITAVRDTYSTRFPLPFALHAVIN